MLVIVSAGETDYGAIERYGTAYVDTRFVHFMALPLFPVKSLVWFAPGQAVAIPLVARSVFAGYGRVYGPLTLFGCLGGGPLLALYGLGDGGELSTLGTLAIFVGLLVTLVGVPIGLVLWVASLRVGRLDLPAQVERYAYGIATGAPVDPAHFGDEVRQEIFTTLTEKVGLQAAGYRGDLPSLETLASGAASVEELASVTTLVRLSEIRDAANALRLQGLRRALVARLGPLVAVSGYR